MIARAIFAALVCLSFERPMIWFSWYFTVGFYVIFVYNNFLVFFIFRYFVKDSCNCVLTVSYTTRAI